MRIWILAGLALLVGAFLYFRPDGYAVSKIDPAGVARVEISRPGARPVVIERVGGSWRLAGSGKVDGAAMARLLSVLRARSDRSIEPGDLSRFGLDKPVLSLTFDGNRLDFGMINPLTGQQYLHSGNRVYLVSAQYALIPAPKEARHAGTP